MDVEERQEAVKELTAEGHGTREIADILGVDPATISRDQHVANATAAEEKVLENTDVLNSPVANAG